MNYFINQQSSPSFQVLSDINAQSFFLGIAAILVLLVGCITFFISLFQNKKNIYPSLKKLNDNQKEIVELLIDVDELPENEISNLVSVSNLRSELKNLETKGLIKIEIKEDTKYVILNKSKIIN